MWRTIEQRAHLSRAFRAAAATMLGERGIFRTLKGEHAEVKILMLRCGRTHAEGRGLAQRRELFAKIRAELLAHAQSEEREFYSVLAQHELTRERAAHNVEEHREIEALLEELSLLRCDAPDWIDRFAELEREVHIHVDEEEDLVFPLAMRALTPERVREIDRRFRVEKKRSMRALVHELH